MRRLFTFILAISVTILLWGTIQSTEPREYTAHNPILIEDNDEFTLENGVIAGSGTEDDPYIIAADISTAGVRGWEIEAKVGWGIWIKETTAHFIISGCKIYGAKPMPQTVGSAIHLEGVRNGRVEGCKLVENRYGIFLEGSAEIEIINNCIKDNKDGIRLEDSTQGKIDSNIVMNNTDGIILEASTQNVLFKNSIRSSKHYGIVLIDSSGNTLINNELSDNQRGGLRVYGNRVTDYDNSIDRSNKINGKSIYYLYKERVRDFASGSGTEDDPYILEGIDTTHLTVAGIDHLVIRRSIVSQGDGMGLAYTENVRLHAVIVAGNWEGIRLESCQGIELIGNTVEENWSGIVLLNSSENEIAANSVKGNSNFGIYLTNSSNNRIYHNNFNKNGTNAYDNRPNRWDDGYPSGGNYWDDYTGEDANGDGIGDTPYRILGWGNEDRYPLMEPIGGTG